MSDILLYSGGLDSYIAWHYLGKPPTLYVRLGHRYQKKEFEAVYNTIPETYMTPTWPMGTFEQEDAEIPARNLLLAMVGSLYGSHKVWLVVQKDETSIPDRSDRFFKETSSYLSFLLGRQVVVDTPFWDMDKTGMVQWYVEHGGNIPSLLRTVGCYSAGGLQEHCGDCGACFRRYVALRNNGINPGYELSARIIAFYRDKLGDYSQERQERMRQWLPE